MRLTLVLALLGLTPPAAPAASACRGPFPTWEQALAGAERIFVGTVTAVGQPERATAAALGTVPITFRVERVWRGAPEPALVVRTGNNTCGLRAEVGQQWVILAAGSPPGTGATSLDYLLRLADGRRTEHDLTPVTTALGAGTPVR